MLKFWNSCISEWEGWLTLHKGGGSRSFMTMTMTIWWPRPGVWIYQRVTGVTSVVGVPSTHLVISEVLWHSPDCNFIENAKDIYCWNEFEMYLFDTVIKYPRGQWVKCFLWYFVCQCTGVCISDLFILYAKVWDIALCYMYILCVMVEPDKNSLQLRQNVSHFKN